MLIADFVVPFMELTGGNCHKIDLAIIVGQAHNESLSRPQEMPAQREAGAYVSQVGLGCRQMTGARSSRLRSH